MTVVDRSHVARIHVGSALMEKILLHIAPDWLGRAVGVLSACLRGSLRVGLCPWGAGSTCCQRSLCQGAAGVTCYVRGRWACFAPALLQK